MTMFTDHKVDGILCCRGGYGTARLLHCWTTPRSAATPKCFVGYSDITRSTGAFL